MDGLSQPALEILHRLNNAGFEAYIVGGAVRDYLIGREVSDIDITTSAQADQIKQLFPKTIDVAIKHGTVIVRSHGLSFEVTSFRGDSLRDDLKLRDFTINAMALTHTGEIIDPYYGQLDLKRRLIRGVENAMLRFDEDPLRMLRAIRFVSQLSYSLEAETRLAIYVLGEKINKVAIERITSELEKILLGKYVEEALLQFVQTKLINKIERLKPLVSALSDEKNIIGLKRLKDIVEVWAFLLFVSNNQNSVELLQQLKQPNKVITEVQMLLSRFKPIIEFGLTAEDLYYFGLETSIKAERIRAAILNETAALDRIEASFSCLPIKRKKDLALKGNDIALLLKKDEPKARIKELLTLSERAVLTNKIENNKQEIIRWLRREGLINA